MGAHALLAGAYEIDRNKPIRNLDMRTLEDGTDHNGKLLAARATEVYTRTDACLCIALGGKFMSFIASAMGAYYAIRPADRLKRFASFVFGKLS